MYGRVYMQQDDVVPNPSHLSLHWPYPQRHNPKERKPKAANYSATENSTLDQDTSNPIPMATSHLSFHLLLPHHFAPSQRRPSKLFYVPAPTQLGLRTRAQASDLLGDFGARDPFPAEIESGFGDKVLGSFSTEHKILIPNLSALSLAQQKCSPVSPLQPPMLEEDAKALLKKVVGWRLINEGGLKLRCLWKLRDYECGIELINRIYKAVKEEGHFPNIHLEQPNHISAEKWTSSIGGLSMNDFIVAAKIDEIKTSDLVSRKRTWA